MPGSLLPLAIILVIIKAGFKFPLIDGEERHSYWGGPFCACICADIGPNTQTHTHAHEITQKKDAVTWTLCTDGR